MVRTCILALLKREVGSGERGMEASREARQAARHSSERLLQRLHTVSHSRCGALMHMASMQRIIIMLIIGTISIIVPIMSLYTLGLTAQTGWLCSSSQGSKPQNFHPYNAGDICNLERIRNEMMKEEGTLNELLSGVRIFPTGTTRITFAPVFPVLYMYFARRESPAAGDVALLVPHDQDKSRTQVQLVLENVILQ